MSNRKSTPTKHKYELVRRNFMADRNPVAVHAWIAELLAAKALPADEGPTNFTLPGGTAVSKVRIYGFVVSTGELVIDDGTGSILVRSFDSHFSPNLGSPVLVIGRPRIYDGQVYILGEIV